MHLVRFSLPGRGPALGVVPTKSQVVHDLGDAGPGGPLPWLRRLAREGAEGEQALGLAAAGAPGVATLAELEASAALLCPLEPPEVWAAGVTYLRSRQARDRESQGEESGSTPYDRVYEAERPELFFKATGARVVGPGGPAGLRGDSRWQVPEPELGLVLDQDGSILGYTLGDDLSARDIEGENVLYLPQAKIYRASCALGPAILPATLAGKGAHFAITCAVRRRGLLLWSGQASTASMRRSFGELVAHLGRHNWIPAGTVLLTGTGVVPPDDFSLEPGDEILITCPMLGTLRNVAASV